MEDLKELPQDWSRALAVVAHPDDMEFGAASAVAAWTASGRSVSYLLASRGEAGIDGMAPDRAKVTREAEQRASAKVVGVEELEFLDHADGVIEYGMPLRRAITAAIRRHRPDLVIGFNYRDYYASGRWNSSDHRNVGRALLDAAADAGNRWIFNDLGLEPWPGVRYLAVANSSHPTHAVDVTDWLDKGIESLEAHGTYLDGLRAQMPGVELRGSFTALAQQTGQRFGGRLAVAFELVPR